MALTLDALLAPVSEDAPAGEDLSYDPERSEIERTFEREETFGQDSAEAEDRDWRGAIRLIEGQFARSKDLWLAVYLARAGAESGALETVRTGVEGLAGLLEGYWDTVHPQLEELGVPGRKAACDGLANRRSFLAPLERVPVFSHPRLGRFSSLDLERFRTGGAQAEGYGLFRAALDELGDGALQEALASLEAIEAALKRADRAFAAGAGGEEGPNYAPAYAALAQMKAGLGAYVTTAATEEPADAGEAQADAPGGGGDAPSRGISGAVNSREDVRRVLNQVVDYYRKREPGHPMPMIVERAIRWLDMDYVALLKDIAPGGITEAQHLLGPRDGATE